MASTKQPKSALREYGILTMRVLGGILALPVLLFSWWAGQGCGDDPCDISRGEEWRGLLVLAIAGSLLLFIASARYRALRIGIWLLAGVPTYLANRNLAPITEAAILTEAPGVAKAGAVLLGSMVPMLVVTLVLDLWAVRRRRALMPEQQEPVRV